jgi:hypothetical protein
MDQSQPADGWSILTLAYPLNPLLNNLNPEEEEDQCIIYTGRRHRHDRSRYSSLLIGADNFDILDATDDDTSWEDSYLDDIERVGDDRHHVHRSCTYRRRTQMVLSPLVATAVALLLCCCSIAVGASSLTQNSYYYKSTTTTAFVSTVRDSLINTIVARQQQQSTPLTKPAMAIQRKSPAQQRQRITFNVDTTWSNAVRQKSDLNESRFGVRKRVRTVLDKAKKRTGIENGTTDGRNGEESPFVQSNLNIVAEAASLGGLGDEETIDIYNDVELGLEYISRGMGDIRPVKVTSTPSLTTIALSSYVTEQQQQRFDVFDVIITEAQAEFYGLRKNISADGDVTQEVQDKKTNGVKVNGSTSPVSLDDIESVERTDKTIETKNTAVGSKKVVTSDSSLPLEALPFDLPILTPEQSRRVKSGERVQYQDDMGRAGSGFVVWDVKAPTSVVWDCLLDFKSYPQTIPTVREVVMYTNTHLKDDYRAERPLDFEDGKAAILKYGVPSVTRAQFSLSKFRLKIAAVHKYRVHPRGDHMIFTLDPASTNMALKYAKGIWYTQSNPDGKEGYTRVWLLCELRVSRLLPQWIVDYAAARAMPRATTWLKPQTEAAATLWLKDSSIRKE